MLGTDAREETLAFNDGMRQLMASMPVVEVLDAATIRRARNEGSGVLPAPVFLEQARWETWDGVRVRILAPEEPVGTYLHIHGGGWTLGAADLQDVLLWQLVEETGLAVASVEYRLAPEHPFPAPLDDCLKAARHLSSSGLPGPFTIGGESAGAHLSLLTLLQVPIFTGANLVYGAYDLSGTPSRRAYRDTLVLTDENMEWFTANLLPGYDAEERRSPDVSPLYANLDGVPPALFTVGSADPLLDDSRFLAAIWPSECELRVYDSACHGFNAFPLSVARDANAAQAAFLNRIATAAAA